MSATSATGPQAPPEGWAAATARLTRHAVIPVIVIDDENDAEPLAEALLAGGLDVIEVTLRTAAARASMIRIRRAFPEMLVGAGTVVTPEQASWCLDAGLSFAVAPGFNPETVRKFQRAGVPFLPGVLTPSDIEGAFALGCALQKFFPAEAAGGTKLLRALSGPYEPLGIRFCPTGGVSPENMIEYLSLPAVFAVGGSWLATKRQIEEKQWSAITEQTRKAVARAKEFSS